MKYLTRQAIRIVIVAAILICGCNDRTREARIRTIPGQDAGTSTDAGGTSPDLGEQLPPDEICGERLDGVGCELPHAAGVCVDQRCQLVSCLEGRGDCNDEITDGCETDLLTASDCGSCAAVCEAPAICQRGAAGPTCSEGVVCPRGRFDLDFDTANGCEWTAVWEEGLVVEPFGMDLQQSGPSGEAFLVAGVRDSIRYLVDTGSGGAARSLDAAPANADAVALDVRASPDGHAIAWNDGVSLISEDSDAFFQLACPLSEVGREHRSAVPQPAGAVATTKREILHIDVVSCSEGAPCVGTPGLFGQPEYLRAFYPYPTASMPADPNLVLPAAAFSMSEVASCDACFLDSATAEFLVPPACLGPASCRMEDFDPSACAGCQPVSGGCPAFEPQAVLKSGLEDALFYVITRRGVVGLRRNPDRWEPVFRLEERFQPDVVAGTAFVDAVPGRAAESEGEILSLVRNDGLIRSLAIETGPDGPEVSLSGPDVDLGFSNEAWFGARTGPTAVVGAGERSRLVRFGTQVTTAVDVDEGAPPGAARATVLGASTTSGGFELLYEAAGQLFVRRFTESPESPP